VKILVISSNLIGDSILSTGVIEHFYKKNPKAKFTFLIGPTAGQIYEHFPGLEKTVSIKKLKFNLHWLKMYFNCCLTKWDIVIDLRSSLLPYLLLAKKKYIFKKNKTLHHIEQLNQFFNLSESLLFVHNDPIEENIVNNIMESNYKYIVIFPGGNWKPKIWPANQYNKLLHMICNRYSNIKFIIVGSLKEKKLYFETIRNDLEDHLIIDLMGETLTLTSAYMKKSNVFIGNDSGLMHLSIASGLNTIGLFGPTNDKLYGHRNSKSFVIRTREDYDYFNKTAIDQNKSHMLSIQPDQILNVIIENKLL
jgi:ADP-heptose:LPS heptosyltransferase